MSFNIEFTAKNKADARAIVMKANAPITVKDFVMQAMAAGSEDEPVYVKAVGHLFDKGTYTTSTANIEVRPLSFTEPPKP